MLRFRPTAKLEAAISGVVEGSIGRARGKGMAKGRIGWSLPRASAVGVGVSFRVNFFPHPLIQP